MYQRLHRAKRKIISAGIAFRMPDPDQAQERTTDVLRVVYLIFNEGHTATGGAELVREDLCDEAIRLAGLMSELLPRDSEVAGLHALLLLTDARRLARIGADGRPVSLEDQDRTRWDQVRLADGLEALDRALRLRAPGPFQIQAAIAALHGRAQTFDETDWAQISLLYSELERIDPSPVVTVNRAIAVAHVEGPERGLEVLAPLIDNTVMHTYQPLHAARADLLARTGDMTGALLAYRHAIDLTGNRLDRAALELRADRCR